MTHPSRCDDTAGVSQFGLTGSSPPPSSSCWPARLSPLLHRNSSSVSCHSPSAWLIQTTRSSPCPVSRSVQTDPVMTPEPMKDKHGNVFIFTLNLFAWGVLMLILPCLLHKTVWNGTDLAKCFRISTRVQFLTMGSGWKEQQENKMERNNLAWQTLWRVHQCRVHPTLSGLG